MLTRHALLFLAIVSNAGVVFSQQTGTVIGRAPGAAIGTRITSTRVIPVPTCGPSSTAIDGSTAVPEMLFSRMMGDLVCVRHADGTIEQLHSEIPYGVLSPSGTDVAFWLADKHELHVYSIANHQDTIVDTVPGATMRDIVWSAKGRALSYFPAAANPPGIRSVNLDTGKRQIFSGHFVTLAPSSDPEHIVTVGLDSVVRISIANGQQEIVARAPYPTSAAYSGHGGLLGILANAPLAALNAPPPPASAADASASDDEPDCTGGAFFLIVQNSRTKQAVDVPFPQGFDTVLDFSFSPDERTIAVTFGVVGCDYPGEKAQIYLVSLPALKLTPLSSAERMSVKPTWTPDGKAIVYEDYTGSDSPLLAVDLQTRKITKLTSPGQFGPDTWLGWH
jgi:hypothetical protein